MGSADAGRAGLGQGWLRRLGWVGWLVRLSWLGPGLAGLAGWAVRASWLGCLGESLDKNSAAAVNEPKSRGIANIMDSNAYIGPN